MDRLVNPDVGAVGALTAKLLCSGDSWMRRRKLRVDFIDDAAVRLRLSVDFCIPDGIKATATSPEGDEFVHLPLFVLRKAPQELLDFDLTDAGDRSLSLPTRLSNAKVSRKALESCAEGILAGPVTDAALNSLIAEVAESDPPESLDLLDRLLEAGTTGEQGAVAADQDFRFLASLVAWSSIIALPVPLRSGEHLYKLAFTEQLKRWNEAFALSVRAGIHPLSLLVDIPFAGAQSFHLEAHPPSGMRVGDGYLSANTPTGPQNHANTGKHKHALHLYLPGLSRGRSAVAFIDFQARRAPFIGNARNACAAVAAVLVLSVVFAHQLAVANTTVPTLILFLPGLLATIATQPFGHPLTARLLQIVRGSVILCAVLAYLAAAWLLVAPSSRADPSPVSVTVTEEVNVDKTVVVHRRSGRLPRREPESGVGRQEENTHAAGAEQDGGSSSPPDADLTSRTAVLDTTPESERPVVKWLRIGWGILALPALVAAGLVEVARRRAAS